MAYINSQGQLVQDTPQTAPALYPAGPPSSGNSNATIDPNTGQPRGSLVSRYFPGGSVAETPLQQAERELADQMKANSAAPNSNDIRNQIYTQSQAYIDAVDKYYDTLFTDERNKGNIRNDQVRAFNINSGNVGGDFATASANKQEGLNKEALSAIAAEREAKLTGIYDKLDQRARDEYQLKKQEALGNAQGYIKFLEQNQADSLAQVTDLAKAGLPLLKVKETQMSTGESVYDFIKRTTGKSDLELDVLYRANLPAKDQTVHFEKVGNKILQFVTDNRTGETKKNEFSTDISNEEDFKELDGVPYAVKTNPDGTLALRKLEGYTPNPKTELELEHLRLENQKIRYDMSGGGGGGGGTTGSIASDVQAVLEGRNTLYNIRQTMGRTNKAAAYMQAMRDEITKVDPKFDFVASDAGGKAVSSTYFQRAIAAVNSVLPNIDKIIDLSNQVNRVGVAGVDALLQKGAVQIGNQKIANFKQAQKLIADEIGLALGAGTVSDMKLQLGFDVTDPSLSQEVFASNMQIVKEFVNNRKAGLESLRYQSSTTGGSTGGKIRVKLQDGRTGTIDEADFDSNSMTKL